MAIHQLYINPPAEGDRDSPSVKQQQLYEEVKTHIEPWSAQTCAAVTVISRFDHTHTAQLNRHVHGFIHEQCVYTESMHAFRGPVILCLYPRLSWKKWSQFSRLMITINHCFWIWTVLLVFIDFFISLRWCMVCVGVVDSVLRPADNSLYSILFITQYIW